MNNSLRVLRTRIHGSVLPHPCSRRPSGPFDTSLVPTLTGTFNSISRKHGVGATSGAGGKGRSSNTWAPVGRTQPLLTDSMPCMRVGHRRRTCPSAGDRAWPKYVTAGWSTDRVASAVPESVGTTKIVPHRITTSVRHAGPKSRMILDSNRTASSIRNGPIRSDRPRKDYATGRLAACTPPRRSSRYHPD